MSRKTKVWLILATSFILMGCIMFGGALTMLNWDFFKLSTTNLETTDHTVRDSFHHISVITKTSNIVFLPSDSETCHVTCREQKNAKHSVSVTDGTLVIQLQDTQKWYEHISIQFESPKITVYLPKSQYGNLSIAATTGGVEIPENFHFENVDVSVTTGHISCQASGSGAIRLHATTGDIRAAGLSAASLDLVVSTGRVTCQAVDCKGELKIRVTTGDAALTDVTCGSLTSNGNTGDASLNHVIAKGQLSITRSTGDVRLEGVDAAGILIETDTGSVTGSLLTAKIFSASSDTGKVNVPGTTTGGQCIIRTDTGDIKIVIGA